MKAGTYLSTIIVVALLGLNAFFVFKSLLDPSVSIAVPLPGQGFNTAQAYILPISESSYLPVLDSNIPKPVLSGWSALVFDTRASRFLFTKDMRNKVPVASLTKILSAVVVLEHMRLEDIVTVGESALRADGVKQDLFGGERIAVGELLKMMLISSSNDAAYALAAHARVQGIDFVAKMNEKGTELEMTDSSFLNPAGLDDRALSTAYDLLKLVRYSLRYPLIWNTLTKKEMAVSSVDGQVVHHIKNTNQLLGVLPNITGGKTGYTEGALGTLILLVEVPGQNDTIISIVLGSTERFTDTRRIVEWVVSAYRWQ